MLRGGGENGRKFSEQTFARAAPTFRINPTFNFHHVFRAPTSLSAFKCTAIGPVWLFMKLQKRFPPGWLESWNVKFYCPIWQHLEFSGMDHLRDVLLLTPGQSLQIKLDSWRTAQRSWGKMTHSSERQARLVFISGIQTVHSLRKTVTLFVTYFQSILQPSS